MEEKDLIKNWEGDKREIVEMINFEFKALIRQMLNFCEIAIPFENKTNENWLKYQTLRGKLLGCVNNSKRNILDYLADFVIGRVSQRKTYQFKFGPTKKEGENGQRQKGSGRKEKIHVSIQK